MGVGANTLEITPCSGGTVTVWASGANAGDTVFFSATPWDLTGSFDSPQLTIDGNGAKGTSLRLSAPSCMQGVVQVRVFASVCSPGGSNCQTKSRLLAVAITPCPGETCGSTKVKQDFSQAYAPIGNCGEAGCDTVNSRINFESIFSPTRKSLELTRVTPVFCTQAQCNYDTLSGGDALVATFRTRNIGAAGNFKLTAESDDGALSISPPEGNFGLGRAESAKTTFVVRAAPNAAAGLHEITLRAFSANIQLLQSKWIVQVEGSADEAVLTLPAVTGAGIDLLDCRLPQVLNVEAQLENKGAGAGDFTVDALLGSQPVFSRSLRIESGLSAEFPIAIPTSALKKGDNLVYVNAYGESIVGSGTILIRLGTCSGTAAITVGEPQQTADGLVFSAKVTNLGDNSLPAVALEATGLPGGWKQSSQAVDVPAKGEKEIKLTITAASDEEAANAVVIAKSNGVEVASTKLPAFRKASGLSGLFIGAFSSQFALFMLILFAAAAFFYYRHVTTSSTPQERSRQQYIAKLRKLREQVESEEGKKTTREETTIHTQGEGASIDGSLPTASGHEGDETRIGG